MLNYLFEIEFTGCLQMFILLDHYRALYSRLSKFRKLINIQVLRIVHGYMVTITKEAKQEEEEAE